MNLYEVAKHCLATGVLCVRPLETAEGEAKQYEAKPFFEALPHYDDEIEDNMEDNSVGLNPEGWIAFDAFTASAVVQICEALNEENRTKLLSLSLTKAVNVTWKLVEKARTPR